MTCLLKPWTRLARRAGRLLSVADRFEIAAARNEQNGMPYVASVFREVARKCRDEWHKYDLLAREAYAADQAP